MLLLVSVSMICSCEKNKDGSSISKASTTPQPNPIEPGQAPSNEVLTLTGSGIGGVASIVFEIDSVPATFNPNFNTNNAIVFRVPTDALPGDQHIIFKNTAGVEFKVPFKVLGLPAILDVSDYNFSANGQLTLTGKNLADVSRVSFQGGTTELEVVSKTATSIVIKMPATTAFAQAKLVMTNEAGTVTTTQEFVNIDNAFRIFTDNYENGFENGSWGPASISNTVSKRGTSSFMATYNQGNWSADGFANWGGLAYSADYKFLSFWIKGGLIDHTFYITGDQRAGGYGNSDRTMPILVPASVWTYYKIKMSDLELWKKGGDLKQLGWWIPGPDNANETLYFDDVIFIK